MKKGFALFVLALTVVSCNQSNEAKELKTAYIDTSKLLQEYTESKDIEAKYKAKSQEMGKELDVEVARFKTDAQNFQKNAQANGQAWAQQKGAELQKREQQLSYAQQAMLQQLQQESGQEMDSLVVNVRKFIKSYGKEKGYAYIYGTGEAATVLYAEDKYDITNDVVKLLNDKYKKAEPAKVEESKKDEAAVEAKK
ncbi:OmpH family outer membrane protein [Flavobacterium ardleyense]|uniref:OmpH family outer membrane protein n=1 Tax=Flavobacterium ardleyense TaxID=2038737 RepID=UPI00298C3D41|nr:OmpH family outer membrane protein [Flavobacterium ardleyense]